MVESRQGRGRGVESRHGRGRGVGCDEGQRELTQQQGCATGEVKHVLCTYRVYKVARLGKSLCPIWLPLDCNKYQYRAGGAGVVGRGATTGLLNRRG